MVRGQAIPEAVQWIIIRLSPTMTVDDIAMYTNISTCSIERILAYFKQTGEVKNSKQTGLRLHRALCDYDIQVCFDPVDSDSHNKVDVSLAFAYYFG